MFKRITAIAVAAALLCGGVASAYNVVDLPVSMTFAEAVSAFDASEITSATICDTDSNEYANLTAEQIREFYDTAANMTVWRKINPTPFRGTCINLSTASGTRVSYFYNSGIQIGTYGADNYVCYMPSADDTARLRYLESEFFDSDKDIYGGDVWVAATARDFLKLPSEEWANNEVRAAASKNLVPYEFTDKYERDITREGMSQLIANLITVAGNYANLDAYMNATGNYYLTGVFSDCAGRDESIDQLYALGIVSGKSDTEFDPDGYITRQEAAAFITRAAGLFMYVGDSRYQTVPEDSRQIAPWADFYVRWVMNKKIMSVDDSKMFYPNENMSVQQAITIVSRLYDIITYWEE